MNNPQIEFYGYISLNCDFPEYNLKAGNIATFIDIVPENQAAKSL